MQEIAAQENVHDDDDDDALPSNAVIDDTRRQSAMGITTMFTKVRYRTASVLTSFLSLYSCFFRSCSMIFNKLYRHKLFVPYILIYSMHRLGQV